MKKVLFVGFTQLQQELIKKFLAYRGHAESIEVVPEQRSGEKADAFVANGDDAGVAARIALYRSANAAPLFAVGAKPISGATVHSPGAFKPDTCEMLVAMLRGEPVAPPAAPAPNAAASNVVSFPASTQSQASVLIVDDSEAVRRAMIKKIGQYGHAAHFAVSGEEAMAMLMGNEYRLVFLDVMMPGIDGFEVCKRIKRTGEYKNTAVYMLTSKDGVFNKVRGSMSGCDGYLVKPLESRVLREVLEKHLEHSSAMPSSNFHSNLPTEHLTEAERRAIEGQG